MRAPILLSPIHPDVLPIKSRNIMDMSALRREYRCKWINKYYIVLVC